MQAVPCFFKVLLDSLVKNWLVAKCPRGYQYDFFIKKNETQSFICGPYWRLLVSSYNINTFDIVSFFFNPEDLEIANEYELDVTDINEKPKKWAVNTAEGFQCNHVLSMNRDTLHKIVFSDITDISDVEMCEINWVLLKERKFYYNLCKDEDFFELDQFFVHRMKEDDLNFLVMECEVFNAGLLYGHIPGEGASYTMIEPDDDDNNKNEVFTETELSQEMLVHEIRKFVEKSVERGELRRSIRKQGRKDKCRLLLKDGDANVIDVCPRATSRYCLSYFLEKSILLNTNSVKDTFAIPCGVLQIEVDEEEGKLAFLAQFALTDVPSIKYFGSMAMSDDLPDDVFKRCFMVVNLGSFLCPTSSTKPSTKYLGALVDVHNIKFLNWCKLVHDWLVCYIKKYKKDKLKGNKISLTLGGCIYHIAVRYLDFVDFGSIMLPSTFPRIRMWKGDLIKHFNNMVIGRIGTYNAYQVKHISRTCYAASTYTSTSNAENTNFTERVNCEIGNFFSDKVTEGICLCLQRHLSEKDQQTCCKIEDVVIDVLKCITSECSKSGGTLKIESSEEFKSYNNNISNNNEQEVEHQGIFVTCSSSILGAARAQISPEVVCPGERMNRDVTLSPEIQFLGEKLARIAAMSPEVQYLGERSFNNVCNDMSNTTDGLYNVGLSLGNMTVSSGKENIRPKRVVNRSSYLCSPFDINSTSKIEPYEMKLYETITTLCDDPNYEK
ncbi:hypothetical protein ACQ4PT_012387 [Festuca glaucescens]